MTRHEELCDGCTNLVGKFFTPSYVQYKPLIYTGHVMREGKDQSMGSLTNNQLAAG